MLERRLGRRGGRLAALAAGLCLLAGTHAWAGGLDRLRSFIDDTHSLTAGFHQVVRNAEGFTVEEAEGTLAMERPDRFRWDYRNPAPQLVVGDGERIWIYDEELEQVTVKPLDRSLSSTPALLLGGSLGDIERQFRVRDDGEGTELQWVTLTPKDEDSSFQRVRIGFDQRGPGEMELIDNLGQRTRVEFSDVRRNPTLDPGLFRFTPPPGVDVVGGAR